MGAPLGAPDDPKSVLPDGSAVGLGRQFVDPTDVEPEDLPEDPYADE